MTYKEERYRELPRNKYGFPAVGSQSASEIGRLELITSQHIVGASSLVTEGRVFPLDVEIGAIDPPLFSRGRVRHTRLEPRDQTFLDDVYDNLYPQSNSQWDAFGHVAYAAGEFYGGATYDEVVGGRSCSILPVAKRGIVGRGVLIDAARAGLPEYDPAWSFEITVDHLRSMLSDTGQTLCPGDIMVLHTGFLKHHLEQPLVHRVKQASRSTLTAAGLEHSEEMVEFLWDSKISAVVGDNPSVEVYPGDESPGAWPFGFMHHTLLGNLGIPVGELWWLDDLARDCDDDGRYEFFLTSAPAPLRGGFGSPANALALK